MSVLSFDEKSRGRRIKIWLDELPTSALLPIATDEHQSSFEAVPNITYRSLIAIEVLKPYGPTLGYGLIGIEFKPPQTTGLHFCIRCMALKAKFRTQDRLRARWTKRRLAGWLNMPSAFIGRFKTLIRPDCLLGRSPSNAWFTGRLDLRWICSGGLPGLLSVF